MSRDSMVLYVGLGVAIVGYLITAAKPPTEWGYMEWLQAASFVLAWVSGKLGTSPLRGVNDPPKDGIGSRIAGSVPMVLLAIGLSCSIGCAGKTYHTAVVADVALYEAIAATHAVEQKALCGLSSCAGSTVVEHVPGWTAAKSQAFNRKLLPAADGGRGFNKLLKTWKPGTPMPAGLPPIINSLAESLTAVTQDFPDGTTKSEILAGIAKAQGIVLTGLSIVLTVQGGVQ